MTTVWTKVGAHEHSAHDGRFKLVRRAILGGNKWQIFCKGRHPNHKKCPSRALITADTITAAKMLFEIGLQSDKGWWQNFTRE